MDDVYDAIGDLQEHLAACLASGGRWPWSITAELTTPAVTIGTRAWRARRVLIRRRVHLYGYSRRQVREILDHIEETARRRVQDEHAAYIRQAAAELGMAPGPVDDLDWPLR